MPDPNQQVYIAPEQMQGFIDSINALNQAIANISGGGGPTITPAYRSATADHLGEEEPVTDVARKKVQLDYQAQKELRDLINKGVEARIAKIKDLFGEELRVGDKTLGAAEAAERMRGEGSLTKQINDIILDQMRTTVEQNKGKFTSIMDAIQESGLKQLRFGELPPQQILQGAGQLLQRYSAYRLSQGRGVGGGRSLLNRITGGRLGGGDTGLGTSGMIGELGGALGAIGDVLGPATIVADVARSFYDRGIGRYRELTASGQLTGQGTMAGLQAETTQPLSAWLSQGGPFGRLSFGQAEEIVQQAREQGFTGPVAGRLEQGMANVVSHLGIQIGQASEFFTQSMREGGMSVAQVTQEMNTFHDATRNLNMNINDYTQQIMTTTETLRDMGAGTAAPGLAQQITAALPRAYRTPEGMQFLTGAYQKARGVLAAMVGGGANVLNITSQRYARAGWSAMDTLLAREVQRARDQGYTTPNDIATYLNETSPWFEGSNVNQLQQYIQRMEHGRGIGAQMTLSRAHNVFNQRLAAASRKVVRYSQLTDSDLKAMGLTKVYRNMWTGHLTSSEGAGNILAGYRDQNGTGRFHALNTFTTTTGDYYSGRSAVIRGTLEHFGQLHSGPGNLGTFNIAAEEKAKREFLSAAARSHFLSRSQIAELEKVRPQDLSSSLNTIMQKEIGPKVSVGTQVGTITVELSRQAQSVLTLVKERQSGVSNGTIQSNQTGR